MFGYVTIYHKGLAKPELDRYQAYYCGLCRTLGQKVRPARPADVKLRSGIYRHSALGAV